MHTFTRRMARLTAAVAAAGIGVIAGAGAAGAHPLGNFTTNTALRLSIGATRVDVGYTVDLAEIPALKVRQELGAVRGDVPTETAMKWSAGECVRRANGISLTVNGRAAALSVGSTAVTFPPGQAGLSTLRLECALATAASAARIETVEVVDGNFADRQGWREVTATGNGVRIRSDLPVESPSKSLTAFPSNGAGLRSDVRTGSVSVDGPAAGAAAPVGSRLDPVVPQGDSSRVDSRGNTAITRRFQTLVSRDQVTPLFALGAFLLAIVLGGMHALAPGHGKSLMAAYVLSRRGGRRELLTIGGTVALTHTVGVLMLGALAMAGNSWSAGRTLQMTEVASGAIVIAVGLGLLRDRLRTYRSGRYPERARRDHGHDHGHEHDHHHDHRNAHDDGHDHGQDHHHDHGHEGHNGAATAKRRMPRSPWKGRENRNLTAARSDPRFVVTSHTHGGLSHNHVLPAPGSMVSRRQLLSMGLAGGLVPSPSALVVLLGAIALGRLWFGVLLVIAYGVGLALTLMGAGLLLALFEGRLRSFTTGQRRSAILVAPIVAALPLASAFLLVGGGTLLVVRAMAL